jgi:hypothetical protein
MSLFRCAFLAVSLALPSFAAPSTGALIPSGAVWKYLDDGSDQGSAWRAVKFDDSKWQAGPAKLGYAGDVATTLRFGPDARKKAITYYFRNEFTVPKPTDVPELQLRLLRDDGAVVYLNGVEIARSNLPAGSIRANTPAVKTVSTAAEKTYFPFTVDPGLLVAGRNVVAVEVHQSGPTSSDLGFDLELAVPPTNPSAPLAVVRGPYLQQAGPATITVCWRTSKPNCGVVRYGNSPAALTSTATEPSDRADHVVTLTGLTPGTTYFYSVGTAEQVLAGADEGTRFTTSPVPGTPQNTRIWVLGDAGTKTIRQARVRNAFYAYTSARIPDLCLLLGDNAYDRGTDLEYQKAIFEVYPAMLRRVPFWSCLANHDTAQSVSHVNTYPYFNIFTFPTQAECGGVASGSEHYYSFDYGNIHFISLDAQTANRSPTGPMATWVTRDLAATNSTWIIALFHQPPYTKGSHDSDTERGLGEMRRNFLPILEQGGVDLVLNGHSHCYERSGPLVGHYGPAASFAATMQKIPGDGRPEGDGPYIKPLTGPKANQGTVYNVAGSAGQISGGKLNHPAMRVSLNLLGSVVLDIEGNQLDSTFLSDDGKILDHYRIIKRDAPSGQ